MASKRATIKKLREIELEIFQCQIEIAANKEIIEIPFLFWMKPLRS